MIVKMLTLLWLSNQVHLPNTQQAEQWGTKVCKRERVYSWGSQMRRQENISQICLCRGQGLGLFMGWSSKVVWVVGNDGRRQEKWSNWGSAQAYVSYKLFHGSHVQKMATLAWSKGGVLGPLMSKSHPWDSRGGPVELSMVLTSLSLAKLAPYSWKAVTITMTTHTSETFHV